MRAIQLFLKAILILAIAFIGALFAFHNNQLLTVDFIYFTGPKMSLGLWLMVFLMLGALLGIAVSSLMLGSYRRKLGRANKET
ncbi:LapA family protein [Porticoccaceae bacterium]|nr:LapA family protein [Porticoccaceae bacterium]